MSPIVLKQCASSSRYAWIRFELCEKDVFASNPIG